MIFTLRLKNSVTTSVQSIVPLPLCRLYATATIFGETSCNAHTRCQCRKSRGQAAIISCHEESYSLLIAAVTIGKLCRL